MNRFKSRIEDLFSPPKERKTWIILEALAIIISFFLARYVGWNLILAVWFAKCLFLAFREKVGKMKYIYFAIAVVPFGLIVFNIYCLIAM